MKKILFLLTFFIISISPLLSLEFENGVHLINEDNISYKIVYTNTILTTTICFVSKPAYTIKNGLAPARLRTVKGFKILSEEKSGFNSSKITAIIGPQTTVNCLCVRSCSIDIIDTAKINSLNGKTVIIKNEKLTIK